jgi:hypothetical protein
MMRKGDLQSPQIKLNKPMKMKNVKVLAAVVVASLAANAAHAIQKHDPIFRTAYSTIPQKNDPDLVGQLRSQNGTPHGKVDVCLAHAASPGVDRNLVRELRNQNGSPKSKADPSLQSVELAPAK